MTYKLEEIDKEKDKFSKHENYRLFKYGERMRCDACNSIYWRVFYDRAQCMGCKSISRFDMDNSSFRLYHNNLRDVTWVKWQAARYPDGRVRDPLRKRSEFVVYKNLLKCRVGGTELIIHPQLKGYWYYGEIKEEFKSMTPSQILAYLKTNGESVKGAT